MPLGTAIYFIKSVPKSQENFARLFDGFEAHALHKPQEGGLTGLILLEHAGIFQHMAEHHAEKSREFCPFIRRF